AGGSSTRGICKGNGQRDGLPRFGVAVMISGRIGYRQVWRLIKVRQIEGFGNTDSARSALRGAPDILDAGAKTEAPKGETGPNVGNIRCRSAGDSRRDYRIALADKSRRQGCQLHSIGNNLERPAVTDLPAKTRDHSGPDFPKHTAPDLARIVDLVGCSGKTGGKGPVTKIYLSRIDIVKGKRVV